MNLTYFKNVIGKDSRISLNVTKNVEVRTSVGKLVASGLLLAVLWGLIVFNTKNFFSDAISDGALLYAQCLAGALLSAVLFACNFDLPPKTGMWANRLLTLLIPLGAMTMSEYMNGVFVGSWSVFSWVCNVIIYALLYLFIFAFAGSKRASFLVVNTVMFLLSVTNHYVLAYRGTPFQPIDLLYVSTAATVVGGYEFALDQQVLSSTVMFALITVCACKLEAKPQKPQKRWKKIYYRICAGVMSLFILGSYFVSDTWVDMGIKPQFFNQARGYKIFGVPMSFFMNSRYLTVREPSGYDADEINDIVNRILADDNQYGESTGDNQTLPNIICIMNETLADLSVLGEIKTNKDFMPYLRNLKENTIRGDLYVPVIGAGTSNTEFEFLTGVSTAFLPTGSNAFSLYIKRGLPNIATTLMKQNYSSVAFHPYYKNNWNRVSVYEHFGFTSYWGIEDILDESIVSLMKKGADSKTLDKMLAETYPDEEILLRQYVSDAYDYKRVVEMFEQRPAGQPFFMFNVTMQNHGGYTDAHDNFEQEIYLVDSEGEPITEYPKTNQYLSLIYESDKAIAELIAYFSEQEEPTIICIFGDHQPTIEDEFVAKTLGTEHIYGLTTEQTQSRYCTPFYIWANYDIEEKVVDGISANYLSSYLMDAIGIKTPTLNRYLLSLSEVLPVIDSVGYIDANGNYYTYDEESMYSGLIADYEKVCYNYLFDEERACDWLYQVQP